MVNIRSYEVSIWTLQDSFITGLKPSELEYKGSIQEPKMNLKDDGELTFNFKIPMYINQIDGNLKENPIWFNTRNGVIIASMRKIKVIFNKQTDKEAVYEFIINKVTEEHEGKTKYCLVECSSLAFHELGRQGYKINLSYNDFMAEWEKWNKTKIGTEPRANINYWIEKVLEGTNWSYEINMDYSMFPDSGRASDKIYRDPYVSDWNINENILIPKTVISDNNALEKIMFPEGSESNRYNLLQTIAETFQVFCKFVYFYDDNYHIIDKKIIFYNNFIKEAEGIIDFTYGYDTKHISREMDSTDLVSKMYVRSLKDSGIFNQEMSIMDTLANESGEDYLLNFDYLYNIGTITEEQYLEIKKYKSQLRPLNLELKDLNYQLIDKKNLLPELEAALKTAKDEKKQAEKRIVEAESEEDNLVNIYGGKEFTSTSPIHLILIYTEESGYYCNIRLRGIKVASLHLFKDSECQQEIPSNSYQFEKEDNYIKRVVFRTQPSDITNSIIYMTCEYDIDNYIKEIKKLYNNMIANAEITINDLDNPNNSKIEDLKNQIKNLNGTIENKITEKKRIIQDFEKLMGPALREGTWQPEDNYVNYFSMKNYSVSGLKNFTNCTPTAEEASFYWDQEIFEGEDKNYYYDTIARNIKHYPCISLADNTLSKEDLEKLCFVHKDITAVVSNPSQNDPRLFNFLYQGSNTGCKLVFLKQKESNSAAFPALLILGAKGMLDYEDETAHQTYTPEQQLQQEARLSIVNIDNNGFINEEIKISAISWLSNPGNYTVVYPRFQIKNNMFLKNNPEHLIERGTGNNREQLTQNKDYIVSYRNQKWEVTIKPITAFADYKTAVYTLNYCISTAAEAIYLDALEIMKENSTPKVSYTIDPLPINKKFMINAYDRIGQLIHINDVELKFENVMGYISEVELNLDKPWEDSYIVKNYKTKFEDLFSTIVAQTEAMKKNSYIFGAVSNAFDNNGRLSNEILDQIYDNFPYQLETIISPYERYMDFLPLIKKQLEQSFEEAGEILAAAASSVKDVSDLTIESADILAGFKENIKENLTPTTFVDNGNGERCKENNGVKIPHSKFKNGDIWRHSINGEEAEYVALKDSERLYPNGNYPNDILVSLNGWSKLSNKGKLAAITGEAVTMDSENGNLTIAARKSLDLLCEGTINMVSPTVDIEGISDINIHGPDINIYSVITPEEGELDKSKGVHIWAEAYDAGNDSGKSSVDLTASGLVLETSNGIEIKSGKGINIYSSTNKNTAAISINENTGIYMGANKPLIFYSGDISITKENGNIINISGEGASAKLTGERILFGVYNHNNNLGSVVDIKKDYVLLGSVRFDPQTGEPSDEDAENIGAKNGAAGVKITKDYIRMATGTATKAGNIYNYDNRNYISMDSEGIRLANASQENNGALVKVSKAGVLIGAVGKKDEFITDIQSTSSTDHNKMTEYRNKGLATFEVYAPNFVVDATGHLYAYNADISGTIKATSGKIGNWDININEICKIAQGYKVMMNSNIYTDGLPAPYNPVFGVAQLDSNNNPTDWKFYVRGNGQLYAKNADITGVINVNSGSIAGWGINEQGIVKAVEINGKQNSMVDPNTATNYWYFSGFASPGATTRNRREGNNLVSLGYSSDQQVALTIGGPTSDDWSISPFHVLQNGKLYASGAEISGSITATSGTIGGWNIEGAYPGWIWTSSGKRNGAPVIAGLCKLRDLNPGESIDTFPAFAAGLSVGNDGYANFLVSHSGKLYAKDAEINGKINTTDGSIGGWDINTNEICKITQGYKVMINSNTYTSGLDIPYNPVFGVTQVDSNNNPTDWKFYVRSNGRLYAKDAEISGSITATSGTIGGFTIHPSGYMYINTPDDTNYTFINGNPTVTETAFCAGKGVFRVTHAGKLYASEAEITGNTTINTIGSIFLSADNPIKGNTFNVSDITGVLSGNALNTPVVIKNTSRKENGNTTIQSLTFGTEGTNVYDEPFSVLMNNTTSYLLFERWNNMDWSEYKSKDIIKINSNKIFLKTNKTGNNFYRLVISDSGHPPIPGDANWGDGIGTIWIQTPNSVENWSTTQWEECKVYCRGIPE